MTEPAIALREHPQMIELFTVLEQNGLQKQKGEVQTLVEYIDGMEDKLSHMMKEMKEMRLEVEKLHNKGIQARCTQLVTAAEGKIHQAKAMVSLVKDHLTVSAGNMLKTFKEKGRSALRHAVQALRIPSGLSRMEHGFSHAGEAMKQCAGKLDALREELHQAGSHIQNAGRTLAGKEVKQVQELEIDAGALAKFRNLLLSCGKTFSEMERGAARLAEKAGVEKSSVKAELRELKSAQGTQHHQATSKELAR